MRMLGGLCQDPTCLWQRQLCPHFHLFPSPWKRGRNLPSCLPSLPITWGWSWGNSSFPGRWPGQGMACTDAHMLHTHVLHRPGTGSTWDACAGARLPARVASPSPGRAAAGPALSPQCWGRRIRRELPGGLDTPFSFKLMAVPRRKLKPLFFARILYTHQLQPLDMLITANEGGRRFSTSDLQSSAAGRGTAPRRGHRHPNSGTSAPAPALPTSSTPANSPFSPTAAPHGWCHPKLCPPFPGRKVVWGASRRCHPTRHPCCHGSPSRQQTASSNTRKPPTAGDTPGCSCPPAQDSRDGGVGDGGATPPWAARAVPQSQPLHRQRGWQGPAGAPDHPCFSQRDGQALGRYFQLPMCLCPPILLPLCHVLRGPAEP